MVLVSHDRYFLDKVTNRTLELFRGTVDSYTGNFSAYWQQKAERLLVAAADLREAAAGNRQGQGVHSPQSLRAEARPGRRPPQEAGADRAGAAAAGDRRPADGAFRRPPAAATSCSAPKRLGKSYDRPLFGGVDVEILRGQRWGLLGPNGCGKTTLLRCLLGLEPPDAGQVRLGQGVVVGYFDQQLAAAGRRATAPWMPSARRTRNSSTSSAATCWPASA